MKPLFFIKKHMNPILIKHSSTILLFLFIFNVSSSSKKEIPNPHYELNASTLELQKKIIGKLTGNETINGSIKLKSRFTKNDKVLVREYLKDLIMDLDLKAKKHQFIAQERSPNIPIDFYKGANIHTTLYSTKKSDEYVILGAHFDSVENCPGANDNATGVAMIYSLLTKLKNLEVRNKNVMVIFFDDEEKGLIGSDAFAKMLKGKNHNVHSVHTVDQMGWDKDGDRAIELELPTDYLKSKYSKIAKKHNIPIHISDVDYTDHKSFRNLGYNAIGLTEEYKNRDTTPHYHAPSDTYDTINFDYLLSTTNLMYSVIEELITEE